MKYLIAALLLSTTPAFAFDPAAMSDSEKQAFGQAVRDYLMENPNVLIESINVLEERRAADSAGNDTLMVQQNAKAIFNDDHSWVGGNPDGDLTLVEFIDYRCGVCRQVKEDVEKAVADDGNIRFVVKELPILGQESDLASRFAVAVKLRAGDEAYKKVHDALMTIKGPMNLETLGALAKEMGLESEPILNDMNSDQVNDILRKNHQLAQVMSIAGTPSLVIGDYLLRGFPREGIQATIEAARAQ